jgi:hypothetical protein
MQNYGINNFDSNFYLKSYCQSYCQMVAVILWDLKPVYNLFDSMTVMTVKNEKYIDLKNIFFYFFSSLYFSKSYCLTVLLSNLYKKHCPLLQNYKIKPPSFDSNF